jgi:hypothetical protein
MRNGDAHGTLKVFSNRQVAEVAKAEGVEISFILNVYPLKSYWQ